MTSEIKDLIVANITANNIGSGMPSSSNAIHHNDNSGDITASENLTSSVDLNVG